MMSWKFITLQLSPVYSKFTFKNTLQENIVQTFLYKK